MAYDINFNNFTLSQLFIIEDIRIATLPEVEITSKKVPSRHGTIFQGATIGERTIEIDIALVQDYVTQFTEQGVPKASVYNNYIRSIVYYCTTDEPKPFITSDEPDRYLMAICTGIETERLYQVGKGTITFLCNDPYYYQTTENKFTYTDSGSSKILIDNFGTAETYPKVKMTAQGDVNYIGVITPESVVQIGKVDNGEDEIPKTYRYKNNIKTLNGWYYGSQATMSRDCEFDPDVTVLGTGEVMKPSLLHYDESSAPQSPYNWKGTQMMMTLDEKYRSKYFNVRLQFDFFSTNANVRDPSQCGAIQIHLLDINNNQIACCGLNDSSDKVELTNMYIKLGYEDVVKDFAKIPTPTTKRYVKVLDNDDDIPADAKLTDSYTRTKSYATATLAYRTVYIYNTYKSNRKKKCTFTNKEGTELRVKTYNPDKYGHWIEVYLNSKCTSSGWVYDTNVTYNEPEEENVYVYTRQIYPDKNIGKYTDMWGYFRVIRAPHPNGKGDYWTFEVWRLKTVNGTEQATRIFSHKITDSTGTKYTHAGEVAKIAVSFVSRKTNKPINRMSFNYIDLQTINPNSAVKEEPHLIATTGDVIEIDYSVPTVTLNGENILNEVDIGSRFNPIQPFMRTEMQIATDGLLDVEVTTRDRFL